MSFLFLKLKIALLYMYIYDIDINIFILDTAKMTKSVNDLHWVIGGS